MTLILNDAYEIGSDPWDTGECADCGKVMDEPERIDAILSVTQDFIPYVCADCREDYD